MTDKEFEELVRAMRAKQREYFKTRRQDVLQESARLEQLVDRVLWERKSGQRQLFNEEQE